MSKHRRAAKVDNNQNEVLDALIKIPGVSVAPGHDDFLLGYKGLTHWIEWKSEDEIAKKTGKPFVRDNKTYRKQKELSDNFTGSYHICWSIDQLLNIMGIEKKSN